MASVFSCFLLLLTLHLVVAYDRWTLFQQVIMQANTCVGSGHEGGCCEGSSCSSMDGGCYCDQYCYENDDCCSDIKMIGCFEPTTAMPPPTTCTAAGFSEGCCIGSSNCYVQAGQCYCNQLCHVDGNGPCCSDIEDIGCHAAPTNCSTLRAGQPRGCCEGSDCGVFNMTNHRMCYCNVNCYDSTSECCDDIRFIECYPQTCKQAGYTECCDRNSDPNGCKVKIGRSPSSKRPKFCYCDRDCNNSTTNNDCCSDVADICQAATPPAQLPAGMPPNPLRMRQLASLMSNNPSRDWSEQRVENLWRRYQASLLAQIQRLQHRERPQTESTYGKSR